MGSGPRLQLTRPAVSDVRCRYFRRQIVFPLLSSSTNDLYLSFLASLSHLLLLVFTSNNVDVYSMEGMEGREAERKSDGMKDIKKGRKESCERGERGGERRRERGRGGIRRRKEDGEEKE